MQGKHVFESEALRQTAVAAYGLDEAKTVAVGDEFARICRPVSSEKPVAIYFWTMDSPEDNKPTHEKIVRILLTHLLKYCLIAA